MIALKLGGSVITRKDTDETIDEEGLGTVVRALAEGDAAELVVVHGGGSFGHPAAARHGIDRTTGTHDAGTIREVRAAMARLNGTVVDRLLAAGVPAVGVQPFGCAHRTADGSLAVDTASLAAMVRAGFVPVMHGDLVSDHDEGATVCSGDELVVAVAAELGADRVGVCADVPGVYDADGAVIDRIGPDTDVPSVIEAPDGTDVTGGMGAKIDALRSLAVPASIFGPPALEAFLAGRAVGTTIG